MSLLYTRLRENTAILWIQSGGRVTSKENSQYQPSLPKEYTVVIKQTINKALMQVDFKSRPSGDGIGSGRGSYARSDINCHKCVKKDHIQI